MADQIPALVYFLGLAFAEFLRWRNRWACASFPSKMQVNQLELALAEKLVLAAIMMGIWILPLMYLATRWLDRLDYYLPIGYSLAGVGILIFGLWVRYRSQTNLKRNWSPSLVIWEGHKLVTDGAYRWIRHPLYVSLILWGTAQPLLLHNWAAGCAGLIAAGMVTLVRIPREEAMMVAHFGDAYIRYQQRTGALIPILHKKPDEAKD